MNELSKKRRKFVKPKVIQEQYDIKATKFNQLRNMPEFEPAIIKIGYKDVRVDQDLFYDILTKVFR